MARAKSDLIIAIKGTDAASAVIRRVAQEQDKATASAGRHSKELNKSVSATDRIRLGWVKASVAIAGVGVAMSGIVRTIEEGARAISLERQIDQVEGLSRKVEALREGLMGTVDTTTLQGMTLVLQQFSEEQIEIAGRFALSFAEKTGQGVLSVMDRVRQAMLSGRATSFRAFGIDARNTAEALEAMAEAGESASAQLEGSMATAINRSRASLANLQSDVEAFVAEYSVGLVSLVKANEELQEASRKAAEQAAGQRRIFSMWRGEGAEAVDEIERASEQYKELVGQMISWVDVQTKATDATAESVDSLGQMSTAFARVAGAAALARGDVEGFWRAMGFAGAAPAAGGGGGGGRARGGRRAAAPTATADMSQFGQTGIGPATQQFGVGAMNVTTTAAGDLVFTNQQMTTSLTAQAAAWAELGSEISTFAGEAGPQLQAIGEATSIALGMMSDGANVEGALAASKALATGFISDKETLAALNAAFELAAGFATMFTQPLESAAHFTAAALYTAVAAGAWGSSGGGSTAAASAGTPGIGPTFSSPAGQTGGGGMTIVVDNRGGVIASRDQDIGSTLVGYINSTGGMPGGIRIDRRAVSTSGMQGGL